ncbi:MAG TPA: hypothetical protein VIQ30_22440 [Pseudonocardia sp.]
MAARNTAATEATRLGQVVLVVGSVARHNGADVAPAIVTRVLEDGTVNVTVLPDGYMPRHAKGVRLCPDEKTARGSLDDATAYPKN